MAALWRIRIIAASAAVLWGNSMRRLTRHTLLETSSAIAILLCVCMSGTLLLAMPRVAVAAEDDDSGLEEIVVTAQKTGATAVQKTPLAISAFSGAGLDKSLTTNIKDLVAYAPGLSIGQITANAEIYIRGIGTNNVFTGSDPDVTLQIDGVYIARPAAAFGDFLDVERVEVLRGPQGTLYGRNSVGGTINIISKQPSDTFTGQEELTIGNYGEVQEQLYVSGPLIPGELQGSIAFNYLRHDAYLQNVAPGGNDIFAANHGGMRGQLRFEASDTINATTRFDLSIRDEDDNAYDILLAPVPGLTLNNSILGDYSKVALDSPQHTYARNGGISEEINVGIDQNLNLKSITAYRESAYHLEVDGEDTAVLNNVVQQAENESQLTQEFNVQANYGDFAGVAGLYYFHENDPAMINVLVYPTPLIPGPPRLTESNFTPRTTGDAEAAFAQGTYHITPSVGLTVGYRYTLEDKHFDQDYQKFFVGPPAINLPTYPFVNSAKRDFHGSTPKFGIDWQVTDDAMLYAAATRGYKSGGFDYAAATKAEESFNPETIWSYEVGAKTEWFDRKLRANLTGFLYDYSNLQVQNLLGPGVIFISNAAKATIKGIEAEFSAKPLPNWQLTTNLTMLDAHYDSFPDASVSSTLVPFVRSLPQYDAVTQTFNASGNRLDAAPRFTAFFAAQHDWDVGRGDVIYGRAEYYWQDRAYYDPTNVDIQSQAPYGLVNLFAGYNTADGLWQTQLWAKNVTNKGYLITTAANGAAPSGLSGAPRTFGLRVTRNF
jgi:iron complex outermembrane recepter protein